MNVKQTLLSFMIIFSLSAVVSPIAVVSLINEHKNTKTIHPERNIVDGIQHVYDQPYDSNIKVARTIPFKNTLNKTSNNTKLIPAKGKNQNGPAKVVLIEKKPSSLIIDTQLAEKTNVQLKKNSKTLIPSIKRKNIDITDQLDTLQKTMDDLALQSNLSLYSQTNPKAQTTKSRARTRIKAKKTVQNSKLKVSYWQTVHSIESKQGKLLYRPRNKARNCSFTSGPCGHHQLTVQALKDIGCNSLQCRKDRLNYEKSLNHSKKLLALNEKRLKKYGISNLKDYEKYLIHQQGANGIKNIIAAAKGKKRLSSTIKKNMANNSPYSYKQLKRMGSKNAANKFILHWKHKWFKEQRLIAKLEAKTTDSLTNSRVIPSFSDNDLNFALNYTF